MLPLPQGLSSCTMSHAATTKRSCRRRAQPPLFAQRSHLGFRVEVDQRGVLAYLTHRTRDAAQGLIASAAVLQSFEAHARRTSLADLVQGTPSGVDHPAMGIGRHPIRVRDARARARTDRRQRSRFAGAEIHALADADGVPWLDTDGGDTFLHGTVAFAASGRVSSAGVATSTIFVDAEAIHPTYGNGALAVLQLPSSSRRLRCRCWPMG